MAVNISIYSNTSPSTKSIALSFEGEILAGSNTGALTTNIDYFFKMTTGARDTGNVQLPVKLMVGLDSLALNNVKQSASNTGVAYTDIKSMVVDYAYDYIYGHTADQYSSGVKVQLPMQF